METVGTEACSERVFPHDYVEINVVTASGDFPNIVVHPKPRDRITLRQLLNGLAHCCLGPEAIGYACFSVPQDRSEGH